jgi:hypothetical protein
LDDILSSSKNELEKLTGEILTPSLEKDEKVSRTLLEILFS